MSTRTHKRLKRRRGKGRKYKNLYNKGMREHAKMDTVCLRPMVPPTLRVTFKYEASFTNSGSAAAITKRFLSNSIYRPEVSSGTAASPFNIYQGMFAYFRVIRCVLEIYLHNKEDFPVKWAITNSTEDPSASAHVSDTMGPRTIEGELSFKGDKGWEKRIFEVDIQQVVGNNKEVLTDDDFRGVMSAGSETDVADKTWIGISTESTTGSNLTNGVICTGWLYYDTIIYSDQLQTLSGQPRPIKVDDKIIGEVGKDMKIYHIFH
jgi:hypothetical protein